MTCMEFETLQKIIAEVLDVEDKSEEELHETAERILNDPSCGDVFRVKGFLRKEDGQWLELNATRHEICIQPAKLGQEIMIVIGEKLNKEVIDGYWK